MLKVLFWQIVFSLKDFTFLRHPVKDRVLALQGGGCAISLAGCSSLLYLASFPPIGWS